MKTRKTLPRAIREQIVAGEVIDGARWPITGFWCPLCGWPAHPVLQSDNYAHPCCLSKESN